MNEQNNNKSSCDPRSGEISAPASDPEPEQPGRAKPPLDPVATAVACPLAIDILHGAGDWSGLQKIDELIGVTASMLAKHDGFPAGQAFVVALALSNDVEIRKLNKLYRGQDKPTNVLSFPPPIESHFSGLIDEPEDAGFIGDIILSIDTIMRDASEQGKPLAHHLQHLVIHGVLHLLGFNHETACEASEMETIEIEVLRSLNISNPYTLPAAGTFAGVAEL